MILIWNRYRSEIIVILFLIITTLTVYWGVRNYDFVVIDDRSYVTENLHVRTGWSVEGVVWAFTTNFHRHWHPLTWFSHMTDCQLFGLNPGWHHLSSLFLHLVNTLLLFFVFKLMTGALLRSAFVAALFALHPLHVEPVVWIADRKDVLCTFFWILTMLAYVRYSKYPGYGRYTLVVIAFVLGLMAKSMVITLPFVLLLMDYWPLKQPLFGQNKGKQTTQNHKPLNSMYQRLLKLRPIWDKAFLLILVGIASVIALSAMEQKAVSNIGTSALLTTKHDLANTVFSYISYIGKMFWPLNLAIPYTYHSAISIWQAGGYGLLLICVSLLFFWGRRYYPYLLVGWLWYLITLMPVIGIMHSGPKVMADRYTYIPLIGLFIMISWGVPDLLKVWRFRQIMLAALTGILLLCLMMCTWFQVRHWKNSITLFKHTIDVTANNHKAHNNLGLALAEQGEIEEATGHFSEALRIEPDLAEAHNNVGLVLAGQGKLEEAIGHFSEALRIEPDVAEAHNNVGIVLAAQGKLEEAIGHYFKALSIIPGYAKAHNNLGLVLVEQGKLEEAIGHYSKALSFEPDYADVHYNLGLVLVDQGKIKEAIGHFSEALRIKPDSAKTHNSLGGTLAEQGITEEAIAHFFRAISIKPDLAEAHYNLGAALTEQGKLEEAIGHYSEALSIEPNYAEAHNNLGLVLAEQGKIEEAVGHFSEACQLNPNLTEAYYNLKLFLQLMDESRRKSITDVIP